MICLSTLPSLHPQQVLTMGAERGTVGKRNRPLKARIVELANADQALIAALRPAPRAMTARTNSLRHRVAGGASLHTPPA